MPGHPAKFAMVLLLLSSCSRGPQAVVAHLPVESAIERDATPAPGPATLPMSEAEWTTAGPGWVWVHLPTPWFSQGDRQDEVVLRAMLGVLSAQEVRAVRVEGDFASFDTCFDGEPARLLATSEHARLNESEGGILIGRQGRVRLTALETWVADHLRMGGIAAVRIGPRVDRLIEVEETPKRSGFRPRVTVWVLVATEEGELSGT